METRRSIQSEAERLQGLTIDQLWQAIEEAEPSSLMPLMMEASIRRGVHDNDELLFEHFQTMVEVCLTKLEQIDGTKNGEQSS